MKVRSEILKTYLTIHAFTGVIAALVLFIGFFAGGLTLFKPALNAWSTPVSQTLTGVKTQQLDDLMTQIFAQHQGSQKRLSLNLDSAQQGNSAATWYDPPIGYGLNLQASKWHGTLDEQGQLHSVLIPPSALGDLLDRLHRTAAIPGKVGYDSLGSLIMGLACILYFLVLVSGIIIVLPNLARGFFQINRTKGQRRFWLDSHRVLGLVSVPFHIIICLTVMVFVFRNPFYDSLREIVYGEQNMFVQAQKVEPKVHALNTLLPVAKVLERMQQLAPEHKVTRLVYSSLDGSYPILQVSLYHSSALMRGPITDYVFVHPFTGQVLNGSVIPGEDGLWGRVTAVFYGLHFGSFAGDGGRWLYFILALLGCVIFYSGNLLWIDKRRKLLPESRSCKLLANMTVGICFGVILAVTSTMILGRWLYAHVDNINDIYIISYYVVFISALIVAFWLGQHRAKTWLIRLIAVSCVLMPLTSLVAWLVPHSGLWISTSAPAIAVDSLALLSAFVCYRFGFKRVIPCPAQVPS